MNGLRTAIGFLTRVPIRNRHFVDDENRSMVDALPWFPVVGLLIGLSQGLALVGFRQVLPALLSAVLAVAFAALVTGAFHHDGLADMADAFGGGWTVEQRLAILKDSRLGTYGTMALILAVATEITALSAFDPWPAFRAIVVAHSLSRAMAVATMFLVPSANAGRPADDAGLGAAYAAGLDRGRTLIAALFGVVITGFFITDLVVVLVVIAMALAAAIAVVALAVTKIGGITGDVLGAIQQLTALATLIVLVGAAT